MSEVAWCRQGWLDARERTVYNERQPECLTPGSVRYCDGDLTDTLANAYNDKARLEDQVRRLEKKNRKLKKKSKKLKKLQ